MKSPAPAPIEQIRQNNNAQPKRVRRAKSAVTFVDNRPEVVAQRKRQMIMNNSPQVLQQKAIQDNINSSPRMLAQRMRHNMLLGDTVQRVKNETQSGTERTAQLSTLAYAQDGDIHVAAGQEHHLPHDARHAMQQRSPARGQNSKASKAAPLHVASTASVVQRLTGYEVETNIPVYSADNDISGNLTDKGNNAVTDPIKHFLAGGLKYDGHYGEHPEGHYTISSDHNNLQTPHGNMIRSLMLAGFLKEGWKHRALANIEYITPARDELAKGGRLEHQADITAVKTHMATTAGLAKQDARVAVPPPGRQIFTGIPKSALIQWITANGADRSILESDIDLLISLINNQAYVQETSGTLPSDIRALYTEASTKLTESSPNHLLSKIMAELLTRSVTLSGEIFQALTAPPAAFETHQAAVKGYISLMASYVLADYVSKTNVLGENSTEKNLLPFLSKTPLHNTLGALPVAVLPSNSIEHQNTWDRIRTLLVQKCTPYDENYLMETFNLSFSINNLLSGGVFPKGVDDSLKEIFAGREGNVAAAPGKPLGLDEPDMDVKGASGQKGIPLEDRFFGQKYTTPVDTDNIETRLDARFKQETDLQLGHIPEANDQRKLHADKAVTALNPEEKLAGLIKRIRKSIDKVLETNEVLRKETITNAAVNATDWNIELQAAQNVDEPQKTQKLTVLAGTVHEALEEQIQIDMSHALKNTDEDKPRSFAGSRNALLKELNEKYDRYVKLKPGWYKPETLRDQSDLVSAANDMNLVEQAEQTYAEQREQLTNMPKDTDPQARMDLLPQIKSSHKLFCTRYETLIAAFEKYPKTNLGELNQVYEKYLRLKPKWYKPETLQNQIDAESAANDMALVEEAGLAYTTGREQLKSRNMEQQQRTELLLQVKARQKLFCTRYETLLRSFKTYEKKK